MNYFALNLILALLWAMAHGEFSGLTLLAGFTVGYFILWFSSKAHGESRYFLKVRLLLAFLIFYIKELAMANIRLAYDIITPTHQMRPGIIAMPLSAKTDFEIVMVSNLLTLTPGTLSVDVSEDRSTLYIHEMYIQEDNLDEYRKKFKDRFERRVLEVLR